MVKYSEGKNYKVIAFVIACFSNDEQLRIIKNVTRESHKYNCKVVFFSTITDFYYNDLIDMGEKKVFDLIEPANYDAIVLMSESFKQDEEQLELVNRANASNVPVFTVDKSFDGCINLVFDYRSCFKEIVRHMVEYHNFRTINYMGGIPNNSFSEERLAIFREVLEENNIPFEPKRCYYGYFWEDPTNIAMEQMQKDWEELPDAIICANDAMALAVIKYLRNKGIQVPEDVAVSGFDAIELEEYSHPRLTTGVYNLNDMIRYLFEMITEGKWEEYKRVKIPIHNCIQIGQSCGCNGVLPCSIVDELRQVKQEIHLLMKYHSDVNQMVANYGNMEDLAEVAVGIANYLPLLRLKELWVCFEERLTDFLKISDKAKWINYEKMAEHRLGALHYQSNEGQSSFKNITYVEQSELIPNSSKFFEENDYCLVTVLHMNGARVGYAVVCMDVEDFNFMAYDPFLTNLRHLLELQQSQRKIMCIYERDQLTDLLNRNGFYKEVQELINNKKSLQFTIINIDMDGLKQINDTYGHAEGDAALQCLGNILKESITDEIAARIGGDEFLIAFSGTNNEERAEKIKDLIIRGVAAYNQNSTKQYMLRASLGAFTANMHEHSLDYFLKKADEMMYITKSQHKREMGELG